MLCWRAPVSVDDFRPFVLALEEKYVEVTSANIGGLYRLCDEFGFGLSNRLSASFKGVLMEEAEARQSQTAAFTFQRKPGESATSLSVFSFRSTFVLCEAIVDSHIYSMKIL
jgi:hypothetical protein